MGTRRKHVALILLDLCVGYSLAFLHVINTLRLQLAAQWKHTQIELKATYTALLY